MKKNLLKTIQSKVFIRPNGKSEIVTLREINPEDADYINQNNVKVSMEDIGGEYCVWFDDGHKTEEGEPDEITILASGQSCKEVMAKGVEQLKKRNGK